MVVNNLLRNTWDNPKIKTTTSWSGVQRTNVAPPLRNIPRFCRANVAGTNEFHRTHWFYRTWLPFRAAAYRSTGLDQFAGFMNALQRCRRHHELAEIVWQLLYKSRSGCLLRRLSWTGRQILTASCWLWMTFLTCCVKRRMFTMKSHNNRCTELGSRLGPVLYTRETFMTR